MMIVPSIKNSNLFNSNKVYLAPSFTLNETRNATTTSTLGGAVETTTTTIGSKKLRLGMAKNIFSQVTDCSPIMATSTGRPVLQLKSNGSNQSVVLGDTAGSTLAVIERVVDGNESESNNTFQINVVDTTTTSSSSSGQLSPVARVTQVGKVLHVTMDGDVTPTHTIHKVLSHPSRQFGTKHVIKRNGLPVASTRYGRTNGKSYLLTVNAGVDACLMTCLAAIADEVHV